MLKLYKLDGDKPKYWETWNSDGEHTIHWGTLGKEGRTKDINEADTPDWHQRIQKLVDKRIKEGFKTISINKHDSLVVEYEIDGFGTEKDLDKRHKLQSYLDEILGWTGLGHCDGGSIGSGTMEAFCYVVDFDLAKKVVERDLSGTSFSDYSRIYKQEKEKSDWPNTPDGDVFRKLEENDFDFSQEANIDINIDFKVWPPSEEAMTFIQNEWPSAEVINPDEEGDGYITFEIKNQLTYDFIINIQKEVTDKMAKYGGYCNSWGLFSN